MTKFKILLKRISLQFKKLKLPFTIYIFTIFFFKFRIRLSKYESQIELIFVRNKNSFRE